MASTGARTCSVGAHGDQARRRDADRHDGSPRVVAQESWVDVGVELAEPALVHIDEPRRGFRVEPNDSGQRELRVGGTTRRMERASSVAHRGFGRSEGVVASDRSGIDHHARVGRRRGIDDIGQRHRARPVDMGSEADHHIGPDALEDDTRFLSQRCLGQCGSTIHQCHLQVRDMITELRDDTVTDSNRTRDTCRPPREGRRALRVRPGSSGYNRDHDET